MNNDLLKKKLFLIKKFYCNNQPAMKFINDLESKYGDRAALFIGATQKLPFQLNLRYPNLRPPTNLVADPDQAVGTLLQTYTLDVLGITNSYVNRVRTSKQLIASGTSFLINFQLSGSWAVTLTGANATGQFIFGFFTQNNSNYTFNSNSTNFVALDIFTGIVSVNGTLRTANTNLILATGNTTGFGSINCNIPLCCGIEVLPSGGYNICFGRTIYNLQKINFSTGPVPSYYFGFGYGFGAVVGTAISVTGTPTLYMTPLQ
jgi:hypothetical protein